MRERKLTSVELYKMIDLDGSEVLVISELEEVLMAFSDFTKKEIRDIHEYFDIDKNGEIDKNEYN